MNELLKLLADNPAVRSLIRGESSLGNLSASEEALLLAAAFKQKPQTMIVVKNNTYTAQRLQERLEPLLHEQALLLSWKNHCAWKRSRLLRNRKRPRSK